MNEETTNILIQLRDQIAEHFSLDELRQLVFELKLDWDELPGHTKTTHIQSLLTYLAQTQRLTDLTDLLAQGRANITWPASPPPDQQPQLAHDAFPPQPLYQQPWFWGIAVAILIALGLLLIKNLPQEIAKVIPTDPPTPTATSTHPPTATPTNTPTITPTPLPFLPEAEGETLILIATFHRTEGVVDDDIDGELQRAIEENLERLEIRNVRVEIEPTTLTSSDQKAAQRMGEQYNASIIIWGTVTRVRLETNFLNLKQPYFEAAFAALEETERTELAQPEAYAQFITQDLPDQISFLALNALGQSFYNQQEFDQAITIIQSAVNLIPDIAATPSDFQIDVAFFLLGWLYQVTEHLDEAINSYNQAIQLDPQDIFAFNNRGIAYYSLGDFEAGIADFSLAIQLDPQYADAFYNRGIAYYSLGDFEAGIADYTQAIQLDPQDNFAFNNRGLAYRILGDYEAAIADYNQAIQLDPQFAAAFNNRGLAYANWGDYEAAIADYNQAIQFVPQFADAFNNRGNVYAKQDDFEAAIADYNQAIQFVPQHANAFNNRGHAYYFLGDYEAAIADLQHYLELIPNASTRTQIEERIQQMQAELGS